MVELQILGHLFLYVFCLIGVANITRASTSGSSDEFFPLTALIIFVPLEIIYWICHWIFVGF